MISTSFEPGSRQLEIQLPEAKVGESVQEAQRYVIEMGLPNTLYLDGQPMGLQNSPSASPRVVSLTHRVL